MIALLAETTYDELFGNPLTPLYMLCILGGLVVGIVFLATDLVRWTRESIRRRRWVRSYRAQRAALEEAGRRR